MESLSSFDYNEEITRRRRMFAYMYDALPSSTSADFWLAVTASDMPLEVIVRCLRSAVSCENRQYRNRLLALIVQRTQTANEYWVQRVLKTAGILPGERAMLADDLYADLCEHVLRALLDPQRLFWEENFLHCLYFERKHVFRAFMKHEGRWYDPTVAKSERVPHAAVVSLDLAISFENGETMMLEIEDVRAEQMLRSIDWNDLLQFVLRLPTKLQAVVLLVFWEGRSEKETAQVLGITDRTVRNRLQKSFNVLRALLAEEREWDFHD